MRIICSLVIVSVLLTLNFGPVVAQMTPSSAAPLRASRQRRGEVHTPEAARAELALLAATYSDAASWQRRAVLVRTGIKRAAGFESWPMRSQLNPIFRSVRTYDGYTVQNIAFESLPGF